LISSTLARRQQRKGRHATVLSISPADMKCAQRKGQGYDARAWRGVPLAAISEAVSLAARQHGVVSSQQLQGLGWTSAQIKSSLRSGWLTRVHRGVYAPGSTVLSVRGRLSAAVLACGPDALISHRSAAVLWKLLEWVEGPIDVTIAGRCARTREGIRLHRSHAISHRDQRRCHGLPVTSPSLTVLELAAIDAALAEQAWNEALLQRLASVSEMAALLERHRGRSGTSVMRHLLAAAGGGFSRQEAERMLHRLIRDAGLPEPQRNVRVHGHELDLWWPDLRLNVEMDGYRWHSTRSRLNRDRERDAGLAARGIRVMRLSYDQLRRPQRVVAHLAAAVALARVSR
jgi:very-short-patch-repair endonuclease